MATQQQQNMRKPSPQKDERFPARHYLRWTALVLAGLAIGASLFLAVSNDQNRWLTIATSLLAGFLSILFSLFTWLFPFSPTTNSSEKTGDVMRSSDAQLTSSRTDRIGLESGQSIELSAPSAQVLKHEREQRGWSQEELATILDIDAKTVSRWERGATIPQPQYRQQLNELFANNGEEPDTDKSLLLTGQRGRGKLTRDFNNPVFLVNQRLPVPEEFYGRKRELHELLGCVARESSASIIGPAHIGKTWLIDYLRQVAPDYLDERISIGYVDAALPARNTVTGFVKETLKAFGYRSLSEYRSPDLALLEKYVHSLQEERLVVLCIDNFDALAQQEEFDLSFFLALRAMAQRDLSLVVTSEKPLINLVSESIRSSPFFNIFDQIKLTPFLREEAAKFVGDKGQQAGFTADEQEYLLKYAQDRTGQWPPLRLQLAGKLLLENKRAGETDLWKDFSRQLDKQYRQIGTS